VNNLSHIVSELLTFIQNCMNIAIRQKVLAPHFKTSLAVNVTSSIWTIRRPHLSFTPTETDNFPSIWKLLYWWKTWTSCIIFQDELKGAVQWQLYLDSYLKHAIHYNCQSLVTITDPFQVGFYLTFISHAS
jgi:hypothetical protein